MSVFTSRIFRGCLPVAAALLLTSVAVVAQLGTSTIRGTLVDPQGKSIEGATITLKNTGTDYTRSAKTTGAGNFSFELIPVGDYEISIEASCSTFLVPPTARRRCTHGTRTTGSRASP